MLKLVYVSQNVAVRGHVDLFRSKGMPRPVISRVGLRTCKTCSKALPFSDFYTTTKQVFTSCKVCTIEASKIRYRKQHPEKKQRSSPTEDKRCPVCKTVKSYNEFEKKAGAWGGRGAYCHDCKQIKNKEIRQRQIDKGIARKQRPWREIIADDPMAYHAKEILRRARNRAVMFNIPCNLEVEDIKSLLVPVCPVLGTPIDYIGNTNRQKDDSPSLDRFEPALGYVKGNVAVISWRANRIKMDATPDEIMKIAAWMMCQQNKRIELQGAA